VEEILRLSTMAHVCKLSYGGGIIRRILRGGQPSAETQDPLQKITKAKKGLRDMAQMAELLPNKFKALSSNPVSPKHF
jgi:hypothetical protein